MTRDESQSGEDDTEYWRTRMGGSRARKVWNGMATLGKRSRRSRIEARFRLASADSAARLRSSALVDSSLAASLRNRMFYEEGDVVSKW